MDSITAQEYLLAPFQTGNEDQYATCAYYMNSLNRHSSVEKNDSFHEQMELIYSQSATYSPSVSESSDSSTSLTSLYSNYNYYKPEGNQEYEYDETNCGTQSSPPYSPLSYSDCDIAHSRASLYTYNNSQFGTPEFDIDYSHVKQEETRESSLSISLMESEWSKPRKEFTTCTVDELFSDDFFKTSAQFVFGSSEANDAESTKYSFCRITSSCLDDCPRAQLQYFDQQLGKMEVYGIPKKTRVETLFNLSIDLKLSSIIGDVSLLKLPSNCLTKPKLKVAGQFLPKEFYKDNHDMFYPPGMLSLDTYVLSVKRDVNINMCFLCLSRERRRSERKKQLDDEERQFWSESYNLPMNRKKGEEKISSKPALLINNREVLELKRLKSGVFHFEMKCRIGCYCKHHQEKDGYKLLFVLRKGTQVLSTFESNPIAVTDDHKSSSMKSMKRRRLR